MSSLASWFIYGDIDWEWWQENTRKWSPVVAGALFGAGRTCSFAVFDRIGGVDLLLFNCVATKIIFKTPYSKQYLQLGGAGLMLSYMNTFQVLVALLLNIACQALLLPWLYY
jgi:hypothetical protein